MANNIKPRVALVHYWLVNMRGGEKVLENLCDLFPEADIYTHVYNKSHISNKINAHNIKTTFIQNLPKALTKYQTYLPLMPLALEQLDLRGYDLVISSESGPAKGVITDPNTLHICYCHSPMRYVWDMYHDYREQAGIIKRMAMPALVHYLRTWDQLSATRVDHFIANSSFIAKRINKAYRRDATVIHPPVSFDEFDIATIPLENYYLLIGQLVNYKRADLAVKAFNAMNKPLIIIGEGEQMAELKKIAGPNITILGRQPFDVIKHHYAHCQALIFPGVEDFGIVPLEAMASGRPVIAYAKGGALETVINDKSGILFHEQTEESLIDAVNHYESVKDSFNTHEIRAHAKNFSESTFKSRIMSFIEKHYK